MKTGSLQKADVTSALESLPRRRRAPVSTYRLQLRRGFGFREMEAILPYLADLGISDCYTSPILKARPGSLHGYDICNHRALNPELGSNSDYFMLTKRLSEYRMGHLLDFVPNHMGIDPETNPWWRDVLENGPDSRFANYFDIYWHPIQAELNGKVLLPLLGDQYGIVLERGDLQLQYKDGTFGIRYFEHSFPIDPRQYPRILRHDLARLKASVSDNDPTLQEFLSVISEFDHIPSHTENNPEKVSERERERNIAQGRLSRVMLTSPAIRSYVLNVVKTFNGESNHPKSFDLLHQLLEAQSYRLAYWKTAFHEINYRRFFDINHLAGLRVENEGVFPATHQLIMSLIAEGKITGLRVDHPDGLYDPAGYFESLQDMFLQQWVQHAVGAPLSPEEQDEIRQWRVAQRKKDPQGLAARPLYIVAEKILSPGEALDAHWAIDGTSGYDFLNDLNGLFVDSRHAERMQQIYKTYTGRAMPFEVVAYLSKKLIMSTSLASELNVLAHALDRIAERDRRLRDFTLDGLREALKEVIACFPVYRTYINASRGSANDRQIIDRAIAEAKRRNRATEPSVFDFIQTVLTPANAEKVSGQEFHRQLWYTMKFQQYTGPLQAKGIEDTAFYRYNVLVSLNEVGGDPTRFGCTASAFHDGNQKRQSEWPYSMLATSTHDTKRGEDSRARLNVLSEIPEEWERQVASWSILNEGRRASLEKEWAPDKNDEYLFYQSLLGAWAWEEEGAPLDDLKSRMRNYMVKAAKEAKLRTSWISPNDAYENAVAEFVERALTGGRDNPFLSAFIPFAKRIARWGMINSLAQVVLKIGSPGAPDFYQGSELWDLNLVDPDNRRMVDYTKRHRALRRLKMFTVSQLLTNWEDGHIKMFVTAQGLRFRRQYPDLFLEGRYLPLQAQGPKAHHVVAFARIFQNQTLIVVVPRLSATLTSFSDRLPLGENCWQGTTLVVPSLIQADAYRNILTQVNVSASAVEGSSVLSVADILGACPVGILAHV